MSAGAGAGPQAATVLRVQGIDVHVEGGGPGTDAAGAAAGGVGGAHLLVLLHGWPDTLQLWDQTVEALRARHRCVRFTLPGFDRAQPARPTSLDEMVALLSAVVDAVSPGQPVTLLLHDWGCVFGYEFAMRHPERVAGIIGADVGDFHAAELRRALGPTGRRKVFAYQAWLALGWFAGRWLSGALGDRITRWQSRLLRCPADPAQIGWQMNYPYAMKWFGLRGGLGHARPVEPACPMLFVYGSRKPFMFHSPEWLQRLAVRPGCAVVALPTGHWVMLGKTAGAFHAAVGDWLEAADSP